MATQDDINKASNRIATVNNRDGVLEFSQHEIVDFAGLDEWPNWHNDIGQFIDDLVGGVIVAGVLPEWQEVVIDAINNDRFPRVFEVRLADLGEDEDEDEDEDEGEDEGGKKDEEDREDGGGDEEDGGGEKEDEGAGDYDAGNYRSDAEEQSDNLAPSNSTHDFSCCGVQLEAHVLVANFVGQESF